MAFVFFPPVCPLNVVHRPAGLTITTWELNNQLVKETSGATGTGSSDCHFKNIFTV